jgi:predicted  nucleic acid-binding Zn-ribbon protein
MAGGPGGDPVDQLAAKETVARENATPALEPLTLATMCLCGHTRNYHRGLRMEATGRCLECGCQEFRRASAAEPTHAAEPTYDPQSFDQMVRRIRTALEQVRQAREIAASLRARLSNVD